MVADAVAAAKFPVGVVIGHAPAKAAGHALLRNGIVDPGGIAQSLHQPVGLVVKGLGGQLLPAELADEVALAGIGSHRGAGFAGGTAPTVRVIVVGVNILQQLALAVVPRACRGTGGVQPVDGLVGALIKCFVVGAAVHTGTPQKDAGVVAALAHHLAAVLQGLRLPALVANVPPAGHLGEHQQAQLIAGIQKCRALGGMAGAHRVAAKVFFQDLSIQPLDAVRHGIALIGVALVAVQAPQLHALTVQVQPACHELHGAEAEADGLFVQHTVRQTGRAGADQLYGEGVQGGMLDAPRVHTVQHAGDGQGKLATVGGAAAGRTADLGLQCAAHRLTHGGGIDAEIALGLCLDEHIPQVSGLLDVQTDGTVDAAVGQVIDLPTKGRNVQILAAVAAHSHHVILTQMQSAGQIYREGGVAAGVVEQPPPVAEHGRVMGNSTKGEQNSAACPLSGCKKLPPVAAQVLVFIFVAVIVGQHPHSVGDAHRFQFQSALRPHQCRVEPGREQPAFVPIVVFHTRVSILLKSLYIL